MKRFISLFLAVTLMSASVFAAEITVTLDGAEVEFSAQEPVIVEGRTLIPLRGVFEQLGYEISWEAAAKTATFTNGDNTIAVTAESGVFVMNGEEISLDVPASIINGSMMLPLRAVGEAAGLEVEWDSSAKTVVLKSGASEGDTAAAETETETEETTEAETETTTAAAVIKDNIPSADLEALQACANSTSTIYSIFILNSLLQETLEYAYYKIDGALEYSYSASELQEVFEDSVTEYRGYKTAANSLKTLTADKALVKNFVAYVDVEIEILQFYYDYFCTDTFDSYTYYGVMTKVDDMERKLDDCKDDINSSLNTLVSAVNKTADMEAYNRGADGSSLTAAQKAEIENYHKEIGEFVSAELSKVADTSDLYVSGSAFVTAAVNIRNKINSTETPEKCILDKQCMLRACDLITQAGTAVKNGAYTKDGKNQYYIEYLAVIVSCDFLFIDSLGEYFAPTEGDFSETQDEVDIDPSIDSIIV